MHEQGDAELAEHFFHVFGCCIALSVYGSIYCSIQYGPQSSRSSMYQVYHKPGSACRVGQNILDWAAAVAIPPPLALIQSMLPAVLVGAVRSKAVAADGPPPPQILVNTRINDVLNNLRPRSA